MRFLLKACVLAFVAPTFALAATVSSPSTEWMAVQGDFETTTDVKNNDASVNVVGQGENHGFFVTSNPSVTPLAPFGTFGFRLRLDEAAVSNKNETKFDSAVLLGIDADFNDTIDVFISLDYSKKDPVLALYAPDDKRANNSPKTSRTDKDPFKQYVVTSENFDYRAVDYLTDGGTTNDLNPNGNGEQDYYVSVMVDFEDIVTYLSGEGILITDTSSLRFVAGTSRQGDKFDVDIAGIDGGTNSGDSWSELGGFSQSMNRESFLSIPEPSNAVLTAAGVMLLLLRRKR